MSARDPRTGRFVREQGTDPLELAHLSDRRIAIAWWITRLLWRALGARVTKP
jgi:hypothetical protein